MKWAIKKPSLRTAQTINVSGKNPLRLLWQAQGATNNDLHKASGGAAKHKPANWMANKQSQNLIVEIEKAGIPAIQSKQRLGTFVCKELVVAYAAWISAVFHLAVIRAFLKDQTQPQPTVQLNRVRYAHLNNGVKIYCVKDISAPYFGKEARAWVTEFCQDVQHLEEYPTYSTLKMRIPDGHSRYNTTWCATRQAIQYMLNKHYQNLPEDTRDALIEAFTGDNEPPSAYAEDYAHPPVPAALPAVAAAPATANALNLIGDGRYFVMVCDGEMHIKNLAGYSVVDVNAVRAIADNAKKLSRQYALLTGDGSKNLLDLELDDIN